MFDNGKFGERLRELMADKEISAPELAREIKTDRTNITRYLKGERAPQYETLVGLLDFFDCSADYLLGLVEIPSKNGNFSPAGDFSLNLRSAMNKVGCSQYRLSNKISASLIYYWLTAKRLPSAENLVKLSEILECSVDFLLGREN